ncbi:hypothetical protein WUBG_00338 [Wuchereria bancrofti]|uniref:Uncharacterized protein n=1 Tax=Wuchereria bancrofti TaxID=6293 RepID=J9F1I2_WUCBA|nr:hypothetical protein WUBG_00338 [Wuchereria bancrofti]
MGSVWGAQLIIKCGPEAKVHNSMSGYIFGSAALKHVVYSKSKALSKLVKYGTDTETAAHQQEIIAECLQEKELIRMVLVQDKSGHKQYTEENYETAECELELTESVRENLRNAVEDLE